MKITTEQVQLLKNIQFALEKASGEAGVDENFNQLLWQICPKYKLLSLSMDDLASAWEQAIEEVEDEIVRVKKAANHLLPILEDIVEWNENQLEKVDGEQNEAEGLFTIDHYDTDVYDFFHDETLRDEVDPFEYYGAEKLKKVVAEWLLREWQS